MADIIVDEQPYLYEIGTAEVEVGLNHNRMYTIYHTGKDAAGADSEGDVFAQCDGAAVETTYASKEGKIPIQSQRSFPIPASQRTVKLKTASGNVAVLIVPSELGHLEI